LYSKAADLYVEVSDNKSAAECYSLHAKLIEKTQPEAAAELYSKAAGLYVEVLDNKSAADCYSSHAKLIEDANPKEAAELYSKAAIAYGKASDHKSAADCYSSHAKLIEKAQPEAAAESYSKAAIAYEKVPDHKSAADCYSKCANDYKRAAEQPNKAPLFYKSAENYKLAIKSSLINTDLRQIKELLSPCIHGLITVYHKCNNLNDGIDVCEKIAQQYEGVATFIYGCIADSVKDVVNSEEYIKQNLNDAAIYFIKVAEFYKKSNKITDAFEVYLVAAEINNKLEDNNDNVISCYKEAQKLTDAAEGSSKYKKIFILQELVKIYKKCKYSFLVDTIVMMNMKSILNSLSKDELSYIDKLNELRDFKYKGVIFIENLKLLATDFARKNKVKFEKNKDDVVLPDSGKLDMGLTHRAVRFMIENDPVLNAFFAKNGKFDVVSLHKIHVLSNLQKGDSYNNEAKSILVLASEILSMLPDDAPEHELCQQIMENYDDNKKNNNYLI
ncbi:MAG: hypothetical protein KBD64_08150, partial [Gammaproteobacteria bacterium]|nr:hypothetical protein [Gammaproteobacteria bacterium]